VVEGVKRGSPSPNAGEQDARDEREKASNDVTRRLCG
jgi:hypothetical protein